MKTKDIISFDIVKEWKDRLYLDEGQKEAALQLLINSALEELHLITRIECAKAVLFEHGVEAANKCLNVKAL